ncbi:Cytochrome c oxidase assembly factor 4 [Schistosoma japonicum]|uniref:Cytochrome c oxidase assembly factor 4 n=1 Tax=Schistosoma japonicum TaxID=6182 RepID=A0A4Z2DT96_SCHJA|nr:Cytochrome c oxidase assembly factor 4 [Schistosoma japonicum]
MNHHFSTPINRNTGNTPDDSDEDPVVSMISRTGCLGEHNAILDCMDDKKDWRYCQDLVKKFKDCMDKYKKSV